MTTNNFSTANINNLLQDAQQDETLSGGGVAALDLNDLGVQIQNGLGVSVDDVKSSEVILLFFVVDDSTSIRMAGNTQNVRDGVNLILDALGTTKQKDSIYAYCTTLNRGLLYPVTPLVGKDGKVDSRLRLDNRYDPSGGTPLFDVATVALGTALAKTQEFANAGVPARSITVILTDGENYGGKKERPEEVRPVVEDLLRTEMHLVYGFGIEDGHTDFVDVFGRMGIPNGRKNGVFDPNAPNFVITATSSASDIRQKCMMVSQSAVRASQNAGKFSQASGLPSNGAAGGFGD